MKGKQGILRLQFVESELVQAIEKDVADSNNSSFDKHDILFRVHFASKQEIRHLLVYIQAWECKTRRQGLVRIAHTSLHPLHDGRMTFALLEKVWSLSLSKSTNKQEKNAPRRTRTRETSEDILVLGSTHLPWGGT